MTTALVLGGGAPNLTLMAGALLAIDDADASFDVIASTGAGMLVGLLYAAPRNGQRKDALRRTVDLAVSDEIYEWFPVNFKVFHKPGTLAEAYTQAMVPWLQKLPTQTRAQRLWSDWAWFMSAAMCPTDLNPLSRGLCQPVPWLENWIDFDHIKRFDGDFFISAYNIDKGKLESFANDEITVEQFRAALAMPFIYSPHKVGGQTYIEGSGVNTLNFESLIEEKRLHIDTAVTFDVLGHEKMIREPRSLYDAWLNSIVTPLAKTAQKDLQIFDDITRPTDDRNIKPLLLEWADLIPEGHWPKMMDWSYSNMQLLFDIGYKAGERFLSRHWDALTKKHEKRAKLPFAGKGSAFHVHPDPEAYRESVDSDGRTGGDVEDPPSGALNASVTGS